MKRQTRVMGEHAKGCIAKIDLDRLGTLTSHADYPGGSVPLAPLRSRHHSDLCALDLDLPLSYRHVAKLMHERGLSTHHSCVFRWVQVYAPELDKRCRPYLRPTNKSYRVDETYTKVGGAYKYFYRAVDSIGQTIDFLLAAQQDMAAAKRFFCKAFQAPGNPALRVINVDKNAAYPMAIRELKREGTLSQRTQLRQCRYLNNRVEQDYCFVKRRVRSDMGYGSFRTAWKTLQGIETMHMINKGRVRWLAKGDVVRQRKFVHTVWDRCLTEAAHEPFSSS